MTGGLSEAFLGAAAGVGIAPPTIVGDMVAASPGRTDGIALNGDLLFPDATEAPYQEGISPSPYNKDRSSLVHMPLFFGRPRIRNTSRRFPCLGFSSPCPGYLLV